MAELFQICVDILRWIASVVGITYEEANIWIFVIIHPFLTVLLTIRTIVLQKALLKHKKHQHDRRERSIQVSRKVKKEWSNEHDGDFRICSK